MPIQFTLRDAPFWQSNRTRFDAFYVQDQWTRGRLTLQGGLRYEHAWSWFPEGENGIVEDNQFGSKFLFPRTDGVTGYHDITPRMGAAVRRVRQRQDVAESEPQQVPAGGEQRRAVHDRQPGGDLPADHQPVAGPTPTATSRVDCNLMSKVAEDNSASGGDFCGPWPNLNFGNPFSTTDVNPDVLHGWGIRPYDWQYRRLRPAGNRCRACRSMWATTAAWWGNHFFTDNRAIGPQDFDIATITAPGQRQPAERRRKSRDLRHAEHALAARRDGQLLHVRQRLRRRARPIGTASISAVNARTRNGITFQGGTSTGRGVRDYCAITDKLPEIYRDAAVGSR